MTGQTEKRLAGEITAFYALALPEFHMEAHTHDSCEIMYVTAGSCTVRCGGEQFRMKPNQFVFVGARTPHCLEIRPEEPCSILNLEFAFRDGEGALDLTELSGRSSDFKKFRRHMPPCFFGTDMRSLGYALKDLILQIQRTYKGEEYLLQLLMARAMAELAYSVTRGEESTGIAYLRKACGYIDRHVHESIRVPDLAAYAGVNKSYLQALFARIMGCSITEYVNRKRMEEAVFLLTNSSMKITDIAFAVGYNSRQHFAHTFEKYHGCGPMSYRRLHARQIAADTGREQCVVEEGGISRRNLRMD